MEKHTDQRERTQHNGIALDAAPTLSCIPVRRPRRIRTPGHIHRRKRHMLLLRRRAATLDAKDPGCCSALPETFASGDDPAHAALSGLLPFPSPSPLPGYPNSATAGSSPHSRSSLSPPHPEKNRLSVIGVPRAFTAALYDIRSSSCIVPAHAPAPCCRSCAPGFGTLSRNLSGSAVGVLELGSNMTQRRPAPPGVNPADVLDPGVNPVPVPCKNQHPRLIVVREPWPTNSDIDELVYRSSGDPSCPHRRHLGGSRRTGCCLQ